MPVAKLRTNNTFDALKPMADNSVDTSIRQTVGNQSLLSFSRTADNPVQWVQLFNAFDQPDIPGWPFLTSVKIQMQKCEKCSLEFCSPINYRRHIRVHRRSLCVDKEWHKNRDLLGAFWDRISLETAKKIVSFEDVTLEEVPGSSIAWSLASFIRKPGYGAFPQQYVKAGSALLDIIQSRPARLPISSQELFAILDDASEGTFLSAGTAESMQKFMFDGEAGKIGMEPMNLVACTSFLVEQKLVRAWVADMDAESLRCQKLLVEEEEAAQRRQAKLLEKKRQKKLRQKEQRAKEQANGEAAELEEAIVPRVDSPVSSETPSLSASSDSSSNFHLSLSVGVEHSFTERDTDVRPQSDFNSEHSDSGPYPNIENQIAFGSEHRQHVARWQVQKTQRARNGLHSGQEPQLTKVEPMQKHPPPRDLRPTQAVNGYKVWTRKPELEHDSRENFGTHVEQAALNREPKRKHDNVVGLNVLGQIASRTCQPKPEHKNGEIINTRVEEAAPTQSNQTEQNCEVMIGSLSVILGKCNSQQHNETLVAENSFQEKQAKIDGRVSQSKVKLWRPVSRHGNRSRSGSGESMEDIVRESNGRVGLNESCQSLCDRVVNAAESWNVLQDGIIQPEEFSSDAAKFFLSQRWKEAIAGDHVTLALTAENELPDCQDDDDNDNDYQVVKSPSDAQSRTVLGDAENLQENVVVFEPSTNTQ